MEILIVEKLAGFLAVLLGGAATRGGERAADALGTTAGRVAKDLWAKLGGSIRQDREALKAAKRVARTPTSRPAKQDLADRIARILATDEGLRGEVEEIAQRDSDRISAQGHARVETVRVQATGGGVAVHADTVGPITVDNSKNRHAP